LSAWFIRCGRGIGSVDPVAHRIDGEMTESDRTARAYRVLRELIVRGRMAPGSRIIESEVATRLRLSRTPVRSALQRLQQEGYVMANSPGRQVRLTVAPLTYQDAREVFGLVGEIEGLGARWAAELERSRRLELVSELTQLNDRLRAAAEREPMYPDEVFDLHTQFHWHYLAALDAPRLLAIHRSIKPQAERYRRLYSALEHESSVSAEEHVIIIRRIEDGDAEGAQTAVQVNWRNAVERLARAIERFGERGSW
jgi:DNA-binding GntR family transcriptional regulator